jgi:hypothetical protein
MANTDANTEAIEGGGRVLIFALPPEAAASGAATARRASVSESVHVNSHDSMLASLSVWGAAQLIGPRGELD